MPGQINFPGSAPLFSSKPEIFKFAPMSIKPILASRKWYISSFTSTSYGLAWNHMCYSFNSSAVFQFWLLGHCFVPGLLGTSLILFLPSSFCLSLDTVLNILFSPITFYIVLDVVFFLFFFSFLSALYHCCLYHCP